MHSLMLALLLSLSPADAPPTDNAPIVEQPNFARTLRFHPDMRHRADGMEAYDAGFYGDALTHFKAAARYADKPSQAMIAEMLYRGLGAPADRAEAYAWMDLAAEREYPAFAALRETYWVALTAAERVRALEVGKQIYAEYGDEVAQPRMERQLAKGRRQITGSRVGFKGALQILVPGPGGIPTRISGEQYYADQFFEPDAYFAWVDETWRAPPLGNVLLGPVQVAEPESPPADQ